MGGLTTHSILFKSLKTAHKGLFCSLQANPAPEIFYGQRFNRMKSLAAVVVLSYFTASEKENLRKERKQNYIIKNEKKQKEKEKKNSDYYYLSKRKII